MRHTNSPNDLWAWRGWACTGLEPKMRRRRLIGWAQSGLAPVMFVFGTCKVGPCIDWCPQGIKVPATPPSHPSAEPIFNSFSTASLSLFQRPETLRYHGLIEGRRLGLFLTETGLGWLQIATHACMYFAGHIGFAELQSTFFPSSLSLPRLVDLPTRSTNTLHQTHPTTQPTRQPLPTLNTHHILPLS
jgi:hypothetical protein